MKEKNATLVEDLKRLNHEIDTRLEHRNFKKTQEEHPEATQAKLASELECLDAETKTLTAERKILKKKLKVDSTYVRVVAFEKKLAGNHQRNQEIAKEIKDKQKKIEQDDKRLTLLHSKGFIPPQIEAPFFPFFFSPSQIEN